MTRTSSTGQAARAAGRAGLWMWLVPGSFTSLVVLLLAAIAVTLLAVSSWVSAAAQEEDRKNAAQEEPAGAEQPGLAGDAVPARYAALIEKAGTRCASLTPARLAALLKQESGFNPRASSPAGAQGIAQFMPGTWAAHGEDANKDGTTDVWDPEDAIPSSAGYLCKVAGYVKDVPGDPVNNMLAAYNAGAAAVQRYQGIPPYKETQNYVRIIRAAEKELTADGSGKVRSSGGWVAPVADRALGAKYRATGSSWSSGYHTGIDFQVPTGTPVRAIGPGAVVTAGWSRSYGYQVVIKHQDGYSQYAHLSTLVVATGDQVDAGDRIGLSGSTGNSTGPHLHFEVRTGPEYGSDVDPVKYLRGRGVSL